MASSSYPSVLLLDDLNNPITPLVDIDSIYKNVQSKESVSVVCDASVDYIGKNNFESKKVVVETQNSTDIYIKGTDGQRSLNPVSILTDASIGATIDGKYPSHTMFFQKIDMNQLLTSWYEDVYMRNQIGYEVWYGSSQNKPSRYDVASRRVYFSDDSFVKIDDLKHKIDGDFYSNKMFRINDYNSTNFMATDDGKYPRRGKINPSAEYIWFLVLVADSRGVNKNTLHLYGASGEDSPQEIELGSPIENTGSFLCCSQSKFGVDEGLNENNIFGDGFEYNIYIKYKFINS